MAVTIKGFGSDWALPEPAKPGLEAEYGIIVQRAGTIPAAVGWDASLGITPSLTDLRGGAMFGDAGVTPKGLFGTFSQAQANPTNRYYASPNGNDANAGAYDTPWRSIRKCIEAANAAGAPARIMVTAGDYTGANGFDGVSPTVDVAFVAAGGQVTATTALASSAMNFAVHPTETNTYYITTPATGVSRVLDLTRVNEFGNYEELLKVDGSGICNRTPGSYREGTELYINRPDGKQPTAQNTRVLTTRPNLVVTSQVNVYVGTEDGSPWVIEGSANSQTGADPGCVVAHVNEPTTTKKAFVMENVRMDYAGEATAGANSVTVNRWHGIAAFFNCQGNAPSKDAFNAHNHDNLAGSPMFLTVNCSSNDTGRNVLSCNGLTMHENCVGVDIAGRYVLGRGGTVHNIGTSTQYLLGTYVERDLGDKAAGGSIPPAGVMVQNSAKIWAERVTVVMDPASFAYRATGSPTAIYRKNCAPTPQPDGGQGTFGTF